MVIPIPHQDKDAWWQQSQVAAMLKVAFAVRFTNCPAKPRLMGGVAISVVMDSGSRINSPLGVKRLRYTTINFAMSGALPIKPVGMVVSM